MVKRVRTQLIFIIISVIILINILYLPNDSEVKYPQNVDTQNLQNSASLEGAENIIVTGVNRIANISGYGLVSIEDEITVKNFNNNPIISIFFAIPLNLSDKLIFFEANGDDENTLLIERSFMKMNDHEMIAIYFDTPLLPQQQKSIKILQHFKDLVYYYQQGENQLIIFTGVVYPILPYRIDKNVIMSVNLPSGAESIEGGWGFEHHELFFVKYDFTYISDAVKDPYITPFLENLEDNKDIMITFVKNDITVMEVENIDREKSSFLNNR